MLTKSYQSYHKKNKHHQSCLSSHSRTTLRSKSTFIGCSCSGNWIGNQVRVAGLLINNWKSLSWIVERQRIKQLVDDKILADLAKKSRTSSETPDDECSSLDIEHNWAMFPLYLWEKFDWMKKEESSFRKNIRRYKFFFARLNAIFLDLMWIFLLTEIGYFCSIAQWHLSAFCNT